MKYFIYFLTFLILFLTGCGSSSSTIGQNQSRDAEYANINNKQEIKEEEKIILHELKINAGDFADTQEYNFYANSVNQKVYFDGEDGTRGDWKILDNNPARAKIENRFDKSKNSRVLLTNGAGLSNAYTLGNSYGNPDAWENNTMPFIKWSMKANKSFAIVVRVLTDSGVKNLYYSNNDRNLGKVGSNMVHLGLGESMTDNRWHTIQRDLRADLKKYIPNAILYEVDGFMIRGNISIDDVVLFTTNKNAVVVVNHPQNNQAANGGNRPANTKPNVATTSNTNTTAQTNNQNNTNTNNNNTNTTTQQNQGTSSNQNTQNTGVQVSKTVYEDGTNVDSWHHYEKDEAEIYSENNQLIIKNSGGDFGKSRSILYYNGGLWQNDSQYVAHWELQSDGNYEILFNIQTKENGNVYIVYTNNMPHIQNALWNKQTGEWEDNDGNSLGWSKYVYIVLGDSADGNMHKYSRDLNEDLHVVDAFSNDQIQLVQKVHLNNNEPDNKVVINEIALQSNQSNVSQNTQVPQNTNTNQNQQTQQPSLKVSNSNNLASIKTLILNAVNFGDVHYFVVGDDTRSGENEGGYIFSTQRDNLPNIGVFNIADVGLSLAKWSNENLNEYNDYNYNFKDTALKKIPQGSAQDDTQGGNHTIVEISLGVEDAISGATKEQIKSYLIKSIDGLLSYKPRTKILLIAPYMPKGVVGDTASINKANSVSKVIEAYREVSSQKGLALIDLSTAFDFQISDFQASDVNGGLNSIGFYLHLTPDNQRKVGNYISNLIK